MTNPCAARRCAPFVFGERAHSTDSAASHSYTYQAEGVTEIPTANCTSVPQVAREIVPAIQSGWGRCRSGARAVRPPEPKWDAKSIPSPVTQPQLASCFACRVLTIKTLRMSSAD